MRRFSRLQQSFSLALLLLSLASPVNGMGLRAFVALPVDRHGTVIRMAYLGADSVNKGVLATGIAYGLTARSTLLLALPYRFASAGDRALPVSLLYRHTLWQQDRADGTMRLAWLAGFVLPVSSDQDSAMQGGFVYTRFQGRHELDVDGLYRSGTGDSPDSARFDVSWQYRVLPTQRPTWGLVPDVNLVLEYNAQWQARTGNQRQITAGAQWAAPRWVLEGGYSWGMSAGETDRWLVSLRYHF